MVNFRASNCFVEPLAPFVHICLELVSFPFSGCAAIGGLEQPW
uniref:Uncharacterized protein n=1 Tax=Arundo donax TaxID=35708 RepID=A0A0A9BV96_ARUDO